MNKKSKIGFKLMTLTYKLTDLFNPPGDILNDFDIKKGDVVVDYGCGPGRYIKKASTIVGEAGKVYAVDIHPLAIKVVKDKIETNNLENVFPVLAEGYNCSISNEEADVIYALDMFHHVDVPENFFQELNRIIKVDGVLYIEDGHQSRSKSIEKINLSELWDIVEETDSYLKCEPVK